ncbi:MAG TPA: ECF-type sigma factor [Bryobacteraceae bacterium]|nr:ECF-type sigma factor [Bryobacteraceae bacterium]
MTAKAQEDRPERGETDAQDDHRLDDTFSLVYEELRRLASTVRRNEVRLTINSTALVDEAWLKLKNSPQVAATSVTHFKCIAANAMRQVLVDEARRRSSRKRGGSGEAVFVALNESDDASVSGDLELLDLDAALKELSVMNPRQAQVIERRFFGGMNVSETAEAMGVSESVVERDWKVAKAWLAVRIRPNKL